MVWDSTISVKLPNNIGRRCLHSNPKMFYKVLNLLVFFTKAASSMMCNFCLFELWERQVLFVHYSELLDNSASSVIQGRNKSWISVCTSNKSIIRAFNPVNSTLLLLSVADWGLQERLAKWTARTAHKLLEFWSKSNCFVVVVVFSPILFLFW